MSVILTGYKAGPDNAYKGHPDGGRDTSTGVLLNEKYPTCALPLAEGRTNLDDGDVILIENTAPDGQKYRAMVWAIDRGTLPHGDIDLAKSPVLAKQLGIQFQESESGRSVTGISGAGDVQITRIASVAPGGLKNPDAISEAILKVNERIGNKSIDEIAQDLAAEIKNPESVKLADAEHQKVQYSAPKNGGYHDRKRKAGQDGYDDSFRDEDEYIGYIKRVMQQNPLLGIFLLIMGIASGMIDSSKIGELLGLVEGQGSHKGYGNDATSIGPDNARYNGRGVLGGRVQGLDQADGRSLELPRFDPKIHSDYGAYVAACAEKFKGMREHGNNQGELVKWVMANAGLGEGQPWCAGFASKMYEGTGLYNYTAAAINFAEQGIATNSYRRGNIDNIRVGDTVIYSRTGGNHVGIVTKVGVNANGEKIVTTVEGNTGDGVVGEHTRTFSQMQGANFMGYVDIRHREQKLIEMGQLKEPIITTMLAKWSVGQNNVPEQTPPAPVQALPAIVKPQANITPDRNATIDQQRTVFGPAAGVIIDYAKVPDSAFAMRASVLNKAEQMVAEARKTNPEGAVVVIDSGHGTDYGHEHDTGTTHGGHSEEAIVKDFSHDLAEKLRAEGKIVVETKDLMAGDWGSGENAKWFSLTTRKEIASQIGATSFTSIHADEGKEAGLKTYYYGDNHLASAFNKAMGGRADGVRDDSATGVGNVKVLRANDKIPSALIELGSIETSDIRHLDFSTAEGRRWKTEKVDAAASVISAEADAVKKQREAEKATAEAEAKAAAEAALRAAEAKAAAEKAAAEAAAAKAAAEKAEAEAKAAKAKSADATSPEDAAKAAALAVVSKIAPENRPDSTKPTADKDPAETFAMHNATIAAANKDAAKIPPTAKAAQASTATQIA